MRAIITAPAFAMIALSGCGSSSTTQPPQESSPNLRGRDSASAPAPADVGGNPQNQSADVRSGAGSPGTASGLPDDRTPLEEPRGPIDYRSAEGAGQVVQQYGGLLEQRKFLQARLLWSNGGNASGLTPTEFAAAYEKYATIQSEVGRPTGMEGAAGSSYITVPFRLYGTLKGGGRYNLVGPLTLRRVNDVPGSTDEQRHWHIERSDLKASG